MSLCQTGELFDHRWEWTATLDGGGYWRCLNANCGEVDFESTGHQGG